MRFDHFEGLSPRGRRVIFRTVNVREIVRRVHPGGRVEEFERDRIPALASKKRLSRLCGSYSHTAGHLHRYTMYNGRVYEEFVQEVRHCGGPHYFIALKDAQGKVVEHSLWTEAEIDERA